MDAVGTVLAPRLPGPENRSAIHTKTPEFIGEGSILPITFYADVSGYPKKHPTRMPSDARLPQSASAYVQSPALKSSLP
jgi:hypothetical protein